MKEIYLDHAATTPLDSEVLETMLPYLNEKYGNAGSRHKKGQEARIALDQARSTIANILNCKEKELIFTGSATEANNLALFGIARANKEKGLHLISSKIEHPSILEPLHALKKEGFNTTLINANKEGLIDLEQLDQSITSETTLVSIMHANNEIGTIQPIEKISKICQRHNVPLHTDACQTAGTLSLNTKELGVDSMTINGSKIYGPKGIGILFIKQGINISPIIHGGNQEHGLRSGTENIATIIGMAKALELSQKNREDESKRLTTLRDFFIEEILKFPNTKINGSLEKRLPNNINITIKGIDAEQTLLRLDDQGIFISTGSACSAKKTETSHVLKAIKLSEEEIYSTLRITLGKSTTKEDLENTITILHKILPA